MIKNRIAATAALFTFALAGIGGAVLAAASPAHAAPLTNSSSAATTSSGPAETGAGQPFKMGDIPGTKVGNTAPHVDTGSHRELFEASVRVL